jgi:hypothetical protein
MSRASLVLLVALLAPEPLGAETTAPPMTSVRVERESYRGWPNTYRLGNGLLEVRVVTDIGPRIADLRRAGGDNLLYVRDSEAGGSGEKEWMFRGGWRLWISPEKRETTYALDNLPCRAEIVGANTLRVIGPPQPEAGIRKRVDVTLVPGEPTVRIDGRIENVSPRPVTYAAWSLPALRPGGRAFAPLDVGPPTSFDAIRRLILWSYTEVGDPRYRLGDRLVEVDQSQVKPPPAGQPGRRDDESKIGTDSRQGWAAYLIGDTLFLKRWRHEGGERTDGGATTEIYSSHEFLELEHLGPLKTIRPGEEIELSEEWTLVGGVSVPRDESGALEVLRGLGAGREED